MGFFEVEFMNRIQSRYSGMFTFRYGTQEDILCYQTLDDFDGMMSYRDDVAESPGSQFRIFDKNPLHLGFFLSSITTEGILYTLLAIL